MLLNVITDQLPQLNKQTVNISLSKTRVSVCGNVIFWLGLSPL